MPWQHASPQPDWAPWPLKHHCCTDAQPNVGNALSLTQRFHPSFLAQRPHSHSNTRQSRRQTAPCSFCVLICCIVNTRRAAGQDRQCGRQAPCELVEARDSAASHVGGSPAHTTQEALGAQQQQLARAQLQGEVRVSTGHSMANLRTQGPRHAYVHAEERFKSKGLCAEPPMMGQVSCMPIHWVHSCSPPTSWREGALLFPCAAV